MSGEIFLGMLPELARFSKKILMIVRVNRGDRGIRRGRKLREIRKDIRIFLIVVRTIIIIKVRLKIV